MSLSIEFTTETTEQNSITKHLIVIRLQDRSTQYFCDVPEITLKNHFSEFNIFSLVKEGLYPPCFVRSGPWARFSNVPRTFRARKASC